MNNNNEYKARRKTTQPSALVIADKDLKESIEKIIRTNRLYIIISQINQLILHSTDELTLFKEICKMSIELGKFRMAWIGILNEKTKNVVPVAHAGEEQGYLSKIKPISVENVKQGRGPTGTAFREGKYSFCNDIENNPKMTPWKTEALSHGYYSSIALPLKKAGKVTGVFTLYASEPDFFDEKEIVLLNEIARDVSFALDYFENEELRKKTEKELIEKEFFLRESQKVAKIGSYETNFTTGYWKSSETLDDIFGIDQNYDRSIAGWVKIIHPDDQQKMDEYLRLEVIGNQKSFNTEYRIVRINDKQTRWVHGLGELIFDASGIIKKMIGTIQDITERKRAEEKIRKFYQAIEQTNEIVFMTDVDGTFTFANTAFEDVYGYKKKEVIGKTTPRILNSGLMKKHFYEDMWKKLSTGKGLRQEIINKTKDGRLINIHSSLNPIFDDQKKLIGYLAVQEDITSKKIAEKKLLDAESKYRTLFEQSADGISIVDPITLLPLDFNEMMHSQLGYSREEFVRLKISDYDLNYSEEAIKERIRKIKIHGQVNFESRYKKKNGNIINVQVTVLSINLQGKPQFYATYRDVTEKMKLEKEIKQKQMEQQRQIMEATMLGQEQEKNELGKELHDNINQILATVKIYLSMAKPKENISKEPSLLSQGYDYLNLAMEEIRKLTHSLVAPSLGERGIHEALHNLMEEINETRDFKMTLVDEMDKDQTIDEKKALMLYRITQEQINNIQKYSKAKNVIVHLKEKEAQLELSISDDGVGFDTSKKAIGIGLKNIQSRVEFYSGNMNIISSPGKGCKLELSIPI